MSSPLETESPEVAEDPEGFLQDPLFSRYIEMLAVAEPYLSAPDTHPIWDDLQGLSRDSIRLSILQLACAPSHARAEANLLELSLRTKSTESLATKKARKEVKRKKIAGGRFTEQQVSLDDAKSIAKASKMYVTACRKEANALKIAKVLRHASYKVEEVTNALKKRIDALLKEMQYLPR